MSAYIVDCQACGSKDWAHSGPLKFNCPCCRNDDLKREQGLCDKISELYAQISDLQSTTIPEEVRGAIVWAKFKTDEDWGIILEWLESMEPTNATN